MRLIDIYESFVPLKQLSKCRFANYKLSKDIFMLNKQVQDLCAFYIEEESKLVNLYSKKDENGKIIRTDDSRIMLESPEAKVEFEIKLKELRDTEIDEIFKIDISGDCFINVSEIPSPEDMAKLEVLINWK